MVFILIFMCMIFCHIFDDYYLQGWLASAKQKSWWEKNAPDPMYKNDYKVALVCHGLSWSFMTLLPITIFNLFVVKDNLWWFFICLWFIANAIIHVIVDNEKANKHRINLIEDQFFHLLQILGALLSFILFYYNYI